MKQFINLLKLFLVIISFSNCERNEQENSSQQNHQLNEYSFNEIIKKPKFNKAYNLFNHKLNKSKTTQKSNVLLKDSDFKIDSTTIKEISVGSITTYTMRITRPEQSEDYFENLVVKVNEKDSINAYIIKYFPNKEMTYNKDHKSFGFNGTTETKEIIFKPGIFQQYNMEAYHCDVYLLCDYGGTTHSAGYKCTQTYVASFCGGGGGGSGGVTTTGGSGTLYTSVVYLSEEEALEKYNSFYTNLLPEQKEILQANNNEAGQQVFNFLWLNNFASSKKSYVKQLTDFCRTNTSVSWNILINNRTSFDTSTDDIDNNTVDGFDTTTYSDFNPQQTWTNIPSIIPTSKFVGWNRLAHPTWQCMEYSKEQLRVMGYKISNYGTTSQTFQIYTAQNGVNNTALANGLSYLKYALSNNIPVIVGVDNHSGSPNPGTDNTTDHFIVIVGMGQDSTGKYFQFYDNADGEVIKGTSPLNKLYYNSTTGLIKGTSQADPYAVGLTYTITMIRKSKQL